MVALTCMVINHIQYDLDACRVDGFDHVPKLGHGIVASAATLDLAMIMGTGFPPFRGGLLRWADSEGLRQIVDGLARFEDRLGARFAPAPLLKELAERDGTFTNTV